MLRMTVGALLTAIGSLVATQANAQEYIETHNDWEAYQYDDQDGQGNSGRTCFMVSKATDHTGPGSEESRIYVTHRPWRNETGVVSIDFGFDPDDDASIRAVIGGASFELKTWGTELAWPYDGKDREMVNAMIRGLELVVNATATSGGSASDTFSLRGFSAAYQEIGRACNVN